MSMDFCVRFCFLFAYYFFLYFILFRKFVIHRVLFSYFVRLCTYFVIQLFRFWSLLFSSLWILCWYYFFFFQFVFIISHYSLTILVKINLCLSVCVAFGSTSDKFYSDITIKLQWLTQLNVISGSIQINISFNEQTNYCECSDY